MKVWEHESLGGAYSQEHKSLEHKSLAGAYSQVHESLEHKSLEHESLGAQNLGA